MCEDYYELDFMDRSIDTSPIAPELAKFFDEVGDSAVLLACTTSPRATGAPVRILL
jgi:hypothetical protein